MSDNVTQSYVMQFQSGSGRCGFLKLFAATADTTATAAATSATAAATSAVTTATTVIDPSDCSK